MYKKPASIVFRMILIGVVVLVLSACDMLFGSGGGGGGGGGTVPASRTATDQLRSNIGNLELTDEQVNAIVAGAIGAISTEELDDSTDGNLILPEMVRGANSALSGSDFEDAERLAIVEAVAKSAVGSISSVGASSRGSVWASSANDTVGAIVTASIDSLDGAGFSSEERKSEGAGRSGRGAVTGLGAAGVDSDALDAAVRGVASSAVVALPDADFASATDTERALGSIARQVTGALDETGVSGVDATRRLRGVARGVASAASENLGSVVSDADALYGALRSVAQNTTSAIQDVSLDASLDRDALEALVGEVTNRVSRSVSGGVGTAAASVSGTDVKVAVRFVVDGTSRGLDEASGSQTLSGAVTANVLREAVRGAATGGTLAANSLNQTVTAADLNTELTSQLDSIKTELTALGDELESLRDELDTLIEDGQEAANNTAPTIDSVSLSAGDGEGSFAGVANRGGVAIGATVRVAITASDVDTDDDLSYEVVVTNPVGETSTAGVVSGADPPTYEFAPSTGGTHWIDVFVDDGTDEVTVVQAVVASGIEAPVFSFARDRYVGPQELTITTPTAGANIYYRFDYEDPTKADEAYGGPLTISSSTVITAIAEVNGEYSETSWQAIGIFDSQATLDSGNQVTNGDFESDIRAWYGWEQATESVYLPERVDADGDGDFELVMDVADDGEENWHAQFGYELGFPTETDGIYLVEFDAWLDESYPEDFRTIYVVINNQGVSGADYETFLFTPWTIGKTPSTVSVPYVPSSGDAPYSAAQIVVWLGENSESQDAVRAYFDNFSVTPIAEVPDFEPVTIDFDASIGGWGMQTDDPADVAVDVFDQDNDGDNEYVIAISEDGDRAFHVEPRYGVGISVREGDLVRFTFDAWLDSSDADASRTFEVKLDEGGNDVDGDGNRFDYIYDGANLRSLTTTPATFQIDMPIYVSEGYEHPNARLAFNFGDFRDRFDQSIAWDDSATIVLDDLSVTKVEDLAPYGNIVTSAAMRAALLPTIREQEDVGNEDRRFSALTEAEITAYHLAATRSIEINDDTLTEAGFAVSDFDFSAIDLTYFSNLERIEFDDVEVTNADFERIGELSQLREAAIGNTKTNNQDVAGATDPSPLGSLRLLYELSLRENPMAVSTIADLVTPANFPYLEWLGLDFARSPDYPLSEIQRQEVVDTFTAFGDAGLWLSEIVINNVGLTDTDFLAVYNGLLSDSAERLSWMELVEWRDADAGKLTNAVLDEIGTLTELEGLFISGHDLTNLDGLEGLTNLRELEATNMRELTDFGAIASLTGLEELYLWGSGFDDEVADYQAIQQLPSLRRLSIAGTPTLDVDGENGSVAGTELDALIQFLEDENTTIDDTLEELRLGSPSDAYREINADNFTRVEELLPGVEVVYD